MIKKCLGILAVSWLLASFAYAADRTTVKRVIDGDTLETSDGRKIRLVGINAPEIQDLFGQEAKQHLVGLVEGREVDLVPDAISSDQDRYQRFLRYVFLNGTDIDKKMVEDGFAFAYLKFRFDRSAEYLEAEKKARAIGVGIWAPGEKQPTPQDNAISHYRPARIYVIAVLLFLLICLGVYFHFRK